MYTVGLGAVPQRRNHFDFLKIFRWRETQAPFLFLFPAPNLLSATIARRRRSQSRLSLQLLAARLLSRFLWVVSARAVSLARQHFVDSDSEGSLLVPPLSLSPGRIQRIFEFSEVDSRKEEAGET